MNIIEKTAEKQALKLFQGIKLDQLCEIWHESNKRTHDQDIFTVRGWIMDEFERRNPAAYEKWILSAEDNPEMFFATA